MVFLVWVNKRNVTFCKVMSSRRYNFGCYCFSEFDYASLSLKHLLSDMYIEKYDFEMLLDLMFLIDITCYRFNPYTYVEPVKAPSKW